MTTPASGQISFGDLKSELSVISGPTSDISLGNMGSYNMADGFWDTYGFTGQTNYGNPIQISQFYDLQTDCSYEFRVESSITDYNAFQSTLYSDSQVGGSTGSHIQPGAFRNPNTGTINPGNINAVNITHMNGLNVQVDCQHNFPPNPPFNNLFIEYDNGGGYTGFPGSPFQGPSITANSSSVYNSPNSGSGTPKFTVKCYM